MTSAAAEKAEPAGVYGALDFDGVAAACLDLDRSPTRDHAYLGRPGNREAALKTPQGLCREHR